MVGQVVTLSREVNQPGLLARLVPAPVGRGRRHGDGPRPVLRRAGPWRLAAGSDRALLDHPLLDEEFEQSIGRPDLPAGVALPAVRAGICFLRGCGRDG